MARDADRSRVYAAEDVAFTGTLADEHLGADELHRLLAAALRSPWWVAHAPGAASAPRLVAARRDAARSSAAPRADGSGWDVRVAAGQATAATLAHELAHVVGGTAAGHGPAFRRAHLDLAGVLVGRRGQGLLAEAYAAAGLPCPSATWPQPPEGDGALGVLLAGRVVAAFR